MKFTVTRRNANAAAMLVVVDETGATRAQITAGHYGASDRADQTALIEWLRTACEQFEAVNPDQPFPRAKK